MTELQPWVWCLPFFGTRCIYIVCWNVFYSMAALVHNLH